MCVCPVLGLTEIKWQPFVKLQGLEERWCRQRRDEEMTIRSHEERAKKKKKKKQQQKTDTWSQPQKQKAVKWYF